MTNVYRIGVQIAMASNGAQVLGVLSRHLTGVHGQVAGLTGGFNKLKLAIGGALAIGAGVGIISMFKGPLDEARKFEMAVGRFSRFGLGAERTREAAEFAKAMNIAGSTYVENMNRMAEAQGVFRESGLSGSAALRGAKMAAPTLAKIDFANRGLDEESQAKMHTSALAMLRFIEMRGGVNSPEKFNEIANAGFKAITSSGGSVNWENLRQFMARGGVAAQGLNNDVLFGKMEPIITEMKGSTAGTALMTSFGRLSGAQRLPNQIAHALVDMGIWDGSKIQWNSQGGIKRINGGVGGLPGNPMKDLAGFSSDPFAWYDANVRKVYDAQSLSMAERARSNFAIFGRTGGGLFSLYERQHEPVQKSVDAQRKALGIDAAYGVAGGTLNGKIVDLHAKFTNLMERLGEAILPMAVKGLEVLVPAISKLTDWVGKHPEQVAMFAKGAVIIGGALVGLGAVALGAAAVLTIAAGGPIAIIVAGIAALAGAVAGLALVNWGGASQARGDYANQQAYIKSHPGANALNPQELHSRANAFALHSDINKYVGSNTTWHRGTTADGKLVWLPGRAGVAPPAANGNQPLQVTANLNVDGKRMATVVSRHQAGALSGNNAATGRPDPSATLPSPAAGYNR